VQRVGTPGSSLFAWTLVDHAYRPVEPVDAYLRWLSDIGRKPNTLRTYATALGLWWDFLEDRNIAWDGRQVLEALGAWSAWLGRPAENVILLRGTPSRSQATINLYQTAVYGFYRFHKRHGLAVLDDLISTTDGRPGAYKGFLSGLAAGTSERQLVKVNRPKRVVKDLSLEQALAVIAAQTNLRNKFLFALMLVTGMRVGQALGMRHEDFVSRSRQVRIVARDDNSNGAYGKAEPGQLLGTSPVTSELVHLYSEYLHEEYGDLDSDYVFVNLHGSTAGSPLTYNTVNDIVIRTRKRVGFHFTPHQYRHTFATICRQSGVSVDILSKLLTHRSVATTSDIYCHLDASFVRNELVAAGVLETTLGKILP
jgi:integrase